MFECNVHNVFEYKSILNMQQRIKNLNMRFGIYINIYTSSVFCCDKIKKNFDGRSGGCSEYRPDAY